MPCFLLFMSVFSVSLCCERDFPMILFSICHIFCRWRALWFCKLLLLRVL
jgi:hypothetical protein